jgi:hypothetical protein
MAVWPEITEPELLERLALSDEEFAGVAASLAAAVPPRPYEPSMLERALGYPWSRPGRSFVLRDGTVELLEEITPDERVPLLAQFLEGQAGNERVRLLAFGSNAAPDTLIQKFAHFDDADDRAVLVLTGQLQGFDVGAAAQPTVYGSMPATLFPSPGTAVRAAVLVVTAAQFRQLAWSEISYRLGRLDTRFDADEENLSLDGVLGFVSRFGAFCVEGNPVALAAIPASGRTAAAFSQEQLLDAAAELCLGAGAGAETLVRRIFEDCAGVMPGLASTVRPAGQSFVSDRWTPYPPASAAAHATSS